MRRTDIGMPTLISMGITIALTAGCSPAIQEPGEPQPLIGQSNRDLPVPRRPPALGEAYTVQDVLDMYEKDQGMRLKLPVTLPNGYQFVGILPPDLRETKRGTQIVARKAWFTLGQKTVMVCAELRRIQGEVCPETNIDVSHTEKNVFWNVSVEVPVLTDNSDWGDVKYSADPADWTWL